jgi:hypothetical protein
VEPYDWAVRFETMARERLAAGDFEPLIGYESLGRDAMWQRRHPIIIFRWFTCSRSIDRTMPSGFPSRDSTAARARCWMSALDERR